MRPILIAEDTLEPSFVPPKLPHRETELGLLTRLYRDSLAKGIPHHHLITGGIGSGKTALANRLGDDLARTTRSSSRPVLKLYVNCWRRASDRTVLRELLRGVGVSLPDRGYSLAEMLDVFEQGLRREPRHVLIILDEASALVRQETKLIYLLTRSREVGLGSLSLLLVAVEDVLPFLDPPTRSGFGVTHRLSLAPYDADALTDILVARAHLALRPGSATPEVLAQLARIAASSGDARFALELLAGAAKSAEAAGDDEIGPEHVRAAKGSIYPTVTESKLEALSPAELLVLLALARTLRGPRTSATTARVRQTYQTVAEEYGDKPVSRVTFWRTVKELEREGLVQVEPGGSGESAKLSMDEVPASFLSTLLEARAPPSPRKP